MQQFPQYLRRSSEHLGADHVRRYQIYLLHGKKLTPSSVENCASAPRFLHKRTLKRRDLWVRTISAFPSSRTVFSQCGQDEVTHLVEMNCNRDAAHHLMVLYATGRRTEGSRLKVSSIDSQRMVVHVARDKSLRDRGVPLTLKLLEVLGD